MNGSAADGSVTSVAVRIRGQDGQALAQLNVQVPTTLNFGNPIPMLDV
jgi:hypothetical protein